MSALTLPPGRWLSVSEGLSGRERKTEREAPTAKPPGASIECVRCGQTITRERKAYFTRPPERTFCSRTCEVRRAATSERLRLGRERPAGMSYRQWRRARGLCVECPVEVGIGGPARCVDCKRRERARERRGGWRAKGVKRR